MIRRRTYNDHVKLCAIEFVARAFEICYDGSHLLGLNALFIGSLVEHIDLLQQPFVSDTTRVRVIPRVTATYHSLANIHS